MAEATVTALNSQAGQVPEETRLMLETVYRLFNARDIDGVFAHMSPDVDWPNLMENVRAHGYDEIRDYWTRQWKLFDPTVTPTAFSLEDDGRVAIDVHQMVKGLDGTELANQHVTHIYTLRDGRVAKMEIGTEIGEKKTQRVFSSPLES